jgi:ABC-2 type transport system permease protein
MPDVQYLEMEWKVKAYLAQAKSEIRLSLTQGESLLVTILIPVIFLLGFSAIKVLPVPKGIHSRVDFLVPGTMALAVMATGMVSQGIATAVDRTYGVLKRLGVTPLGKSGFLYAKITAILVVEVIQVAVLYIVGTLLGWHPQGNFAIFIVGALLATVAFSGIGLLLAGTLKSEAMIGISNAIYLILLFLGGMIFPTSSLPGLLATVAKVLPAQATSDIFFHALGAGGSIPSSDWTTLIVWAVVAPLLAAKFFHWES